ncbi:hypothetical protein F5B22DRAFT_638062 [Xylaria bambusicola]|uniref:uncharacterized protein n=1 Tax=Xylaria bambusicola TaxID=326684 RepID=UPI002008E3A4|nr:uncharacterized protein F5B22DRAFT_638062 [Xylaria bambusicola]KAI0509426.1 hypothetical protein F5B22DRAFT_638062 [Xylaria bambusicola]
MADPIGVAGTAVGVVSLGLQVFGTLKQYLDDINSRDEQVTKTRSYLEQLKETLDIIDNATRSLQAAHQTPSNVVLSCLVSCKAEMNTLQAKLQEHGPPQQINVKEKLKDFKKRIQYPFQIHAIKEIENCLEHIIDKLLLAIHGLELHSHLTISGNVESLNDAIKREAAAILNLESTTDTNNKLLTANSAQLTNISMSTEPLVPMIQALESNIVTTHQLVDANATQLTSIATSIEPLAPMIESRLIVTRDRFNRFEDQVYTNHSVATDQLGVLRSHVEANTKATMEILDLLRHLNENSLHTNQERIIKQLVVSLVSKPSLLKDSHGSLDLQQEETSSSIASTIISKHPSPVTTRRTPVTFSCCNCASWRSVNEKLTRWRTFYFSKKTTASMHRPGCPRYAREAPEHEKTVGITYTGLQRLCSAAVSVGLCLRYGAGGASISPMFRYHYVVDERQSPPFRMIRVLRNSISLVESPNSDRILAAFLSWITVAYDKQVASPRDVTIRGASLIDYLFEYASYTDIWAYPPSFISSLLNFGVNVTQQESVFSIFSNQYSPSEKGLYVDAVSLVLREYPDLWYRHNATNIDFINYGDAICRSSEFSVALETDLDPICIALLHQDLKRLSDILATISSNFSPPVARDLNIKSLAELVIRWPTGLKCILEMRPDFMNVDVLNSIFRYTITSSRWSLLSAGSHLAESIKTLLDHGCYLTEKDVEIILEFFIGKNGHNTTQVMLQHLRVWRERLREALQTYRPIDSQENLSLNKSEVLDSKASYAMSILRSIGLDPYKMFGLQRGDYRLGSSEKEPRSIFHLIHSSQNAQIAFDLGFRDIDVPSEGFTPLCNASGNERFGYCTWLLDHGANYTRRFPWTYSSLSQRLRSVDAPQYLVIHWIFRCLGRYSDQLWYSDVDIIGYLTRITTSVVRSSWASYLTEADCYDGCSVSDTQFHLVRLLL